MNNYRTHATNARTDQSMFVSPTESDFSEIYDAPDAVRYAILYRLNNSTTLTGLGTGTRTRLLTG